MCVLFFCWYINSYWYFFAELKDLKSTMFKSLDSDGPDSLLDGNNKMEENRKLPFMKFLQNIDNTGEMLNDKSLVDHVKRKRCVRVELMSRKLDELKYLEFSKARCVSFANKNRHKFSQWIGSSGKSQFKISPWFQNIQYELNHIIWFHFRRIRDKQTRTCSPKLFSLWDSSSSCWPCIFGSTRPK